MKAVIFFILVFFSCLPLSAQSEKQTYAPFDWVKINPDETFDRFAWENLPQGITQVMVESLVASPYISSSDPITLFYLLGPKPINGTSPPVTFFISWTKPVWAYMIFSR